MGFTGTSITPSTSLSNITIGTRTEEDYNLQLHNPVS